MLYNHRFKSVEIKSDLEQINGSQGGYIKFKLLPFKQVFEVIFNKQVNFCH